MTQQRRPRKIDIRPGNTLENGGIIVWIYHRKATVQMWFPENTGSAYCIGTAMGAWHLAIGQVDG